MRLSIFSFFLIIALGSFRCSAAQEESPLKLSIVPETSREKSGASIRAITPFYVVARNQSDKPVRVWREWCSWGYFALSLEAKLPDGSVFPIKKKQARIWTKNFPDHFIIQAGEYLVMPVILHDEWEGYPTRQQKLSLRAHYQIEADEYSKKEGVWTGTLVSPWVDVTIYE